MATATKEGRKLVRTPARGWFLDAADPEGGKVRRKEGDEVFDNLVEAQLAQADAPDGHKPDVPVTLAPTGKVLVGKTLTITCAKRGCNNTRVIKPQDKFQVKFCLEHQLEHRKEMRRARQKKRRQQRQAAAA